MTATPTRPGRDRGRERRPDPDDAVNGRGDENLPLDEDLDFDTAGLAIATGSTYPRMEDLENCLLIMDPYQEGTRPSKNSGQDPYPWVECDVWVIETGPNGWPTDKFDDPDLPFALEGFQFTGKQVAAFLSRQMRKHQVAVGVLITGEKTERNRNAPWLLETPTRAQLIKAARFWKAHKTAEEAAAIDSGSAFAR